MEIVAEKIGKKFGKHWVFRNRSFELSSGAPVAITGKNGAGKSTLLKIISGFTSPTEGSIRINDQKISEVALNACLVSPDLQIPEEFTLSEFLYFHSMFKTNICSFEAMAAKASLPLNKTIGEFSTGMKQRTKLITSFYFENDAIFLDEPTSNLDEEGMKLFKSEIEYNKNKKLIVIASNNKNEISLCNKKFDLFQ